MTSATPSQPLRLHSRVSVARIGEGTVLFVGQTSFAPGLWVGICLDPGLDGKNDGSVQGKRYFDAPVGSGVFVRASQVEVIAGPEELLDDEDAEEVEGEQYQSRPSSSAARTSVTPAQFRRNPPPAATIATRPRPTSSQPTRIGSPDKAAATTAPARPTLGSRTSTTSSAGVAAARTVAVASPTKPGVRGSPVKASAAARIPPLARSGTSTPSARPSTATSRTSGDRVLSPSGPAARARTAARPAVGTAARPVSGATARPLTSAPATRPPSRGPAAPQDPAVRTALRPVAKTRPSMAAMSMSPQKRGTSHPQSPEDSQDQSSSPRTDPTSPSAEARKRLDLARANITRRPTDDEMGESLSSDTEELLETSLEGPIEVVSPPRPPPVSNVELNALRREVDELRIKARLAEKRREEERARVKELEQWQEEVTEKLKMAESSSEKAQKMSSQLMALHTSEKELELLKQELEERVEDLTEQLEMAALDREVAEEKAEAATTELETLKQINEDLTLEVEVLKEENSAYEAGPIDEGERTSAGWIQLEKQNERLKEALVRLRDLSSETELGQKRRIAELEKDLSSLADVQDERDTLVTKLQVSEAQFEDVKAQLDDAAGAEEMIEQLTERNLFQGERLAEQATVIEELTALKEVSEELEEVHLETEKQLQEELDLRDMALRERNARVDSLEGNASEYEATFLQFRELVLNLQNDLEALRAERDGLVEEGQNANLSSQSREMLSLNLKLQNSAVKSQARTIDAELGRIKAEQAGLQLDILQPYLPTAFAQEGDQDAIAGLLFFKRMSAKSELIKSLVESTHDVAQVLSSLSAESEASQAVPENLVAVCQLRHALAHFTAVCTSVADMLRMTGPKTYLKCGRIHKEIRSAIEPRVDAWIEALRREELKEADCCADFVRFVRQFEEVAEVLMITQEEETSSKTADQDAKLVPSGDGDLAAKEVGSATLFDLDLDTLSASLSSVRRVVASLYSARSGDSVAVDWQLQGQTLEDRFFEPLHRLLTDIKTAKTPSRKLLRRLISLAANEEAVSMDAIGDLPRLGQVSSKLVSFAIVLETGVSQYVNEVRSTQAPFTLQGLVDLIKSAIRELKMDESEVVSDGPGEVWNQALRSTSHLSETITTLVTAATDQSGVIKISGTSPWLHRSSVVHEIASHNVDLERQALKLQDDLRDLYQQIKARDAALQEGAIKMERLNRQLSQSKTAGEAHEGVRVALNEARTQAKAYQDANESLQAELDNLEKANEALRSQVAASKGPTTEGNSTDKAVIEAGSAGGFALHPGAAALPSAHLETHYLLDQLDAMRGVNRHLREENGILKGIGLSEQLVDLPPLVHASMLGGVGDGAFLAVDEQAEDALTGLPRKARVDIPTEGDLRSVRGEMKAVYSSLLQLAATPKLVVLPKPDLPTTGDAQEAKTTTARRWQPAANLPSHQYESQLALIEEVGERYERLMERSRREAVGGGSSRRATGPSSRVNRWKMPTLVTT